MAAKSPIVDNSDQESLDIFEALLKGDASLITKCVDSGCDVNRPGNDGLTQLCAAIRNGENEIACLLIPYIPLFREEKPVNGSSISSSFCAFLSDDRWHRFNNIWIGNLLLNIIWGSLGFLATQSILNVLLPRFDAWMMSVFHLHNFSFYSAIRTRMCRKSISCLVGFVIDYESKQDEMPLQYRHRGTNLTAQGYIALDNILKYGGNVEPIMLEMLRAGLVFNNVNEVNRYDLESALQIWEWAAFKGHMKVMVALQGMGIDLDAVSGLSLCIACNELNAGLCKYLLHSGASVNFRQNNDPMIKQHNRGVNMNPAVVQCARSLTLGRRSDDSFQAQIDGLSIIMALIDNGEDINQTDQMGNTALSIVCSRSRFPMIVNFLLKNGALPHIANGKGDTPLHKTPCAFPAAPLLTKMLLKAGATPNVFNNDGRTPMSIAACEGSSVLNLDLLVNASDPAYLDWDTLLYQASRFGSLEMLVYLVSKGANPTTEVEKDDCALFAAMERNTETKEATLLFLDHEASGSFATKSGKTALHRLVSGHRTPQLWDLLPRFIEHGADIEAVRERDPTYTKGTLQVTPLWEACCDGNYKFSCPLEVIEKLISVGANPYIEITPGTTVLCTGRSGRKALNSQRHALPSAKPCT